MNAGAVAPNPSFREPARPGEARPGAGSFAAAMGAAITAFASGGAASVLIVAPTGNNSPQSPRGAESTADIESGTERASTTPNTVQATTASDVSVAATQLLSPAAAAAALLVTPAGQSELHRAPDSGLHNRTASPDDAGSANHGSKGSAAGDAPKWTAHEFRSAATESASDRARSTEPAPPSTLIAPPGGGRVNGAEQNTSSAASTPSNASGESAASAPRAGAVLAAPAGTPSSPGAASAGRLEGAPARPGVAAAPGVGATARGAGGARAVQLPSPTARGARFTESDDGLAAQVSRGLAAALRQKSGSITLRLTPEALGQVRIDLSLRGERVSATLTAADPRSRDLLMRDSDLLRSGLEARGLKVEHLQIVSREPDDAAANSQRSAEGQVSHQSGAGSGGAGQHGQDARPDQGGERAAQSSAGRFERAGLPAELRTEEPALIEWDGTTLRLDALA